MSNQKKYTTAKTSREAAGWRSVGSQLPPDVYRAAVALAKSRNVSLSAIIIAAVGAYVAGGSEK